MLFSSIGLSTVTLNKNCGTEKSATANVIDEEKTKNKFNTQHLCIETLHNHKLCMRRGMN